MRVTGIVLLVVSVTAGGCGGNSSTPTAPTPAPVAACVTNNTADVTFENRFSSSSLDIIWDGVKLNLSPVAPNTTSSSLTVAAGVAHTLLYRYAGTNTTACTQSSPVLAQCSTFKYWCPAQ